MSSSLKNVKVSKKCTHPTMINWDDIWNRRVYLFIRRQNLLLPIRSIVHRCSSSVDLKYNTIPLLLNDCTVIWAPSIALYSCDSSHVGIKCSSKFTRTPARPLVSISFIHFEYQFSAQTLLFYMWIKHVPIIFWGWTKHLEIHITRMKKFFECSPLRIFFWRLARVSIDSYSPSFGTSLIWISMK